MSQAEDSPFPPAPRNAAGTRDANFAGAAADWRRKHLCDLATACKSCADNEAIPSAHRQSFFDLYERAKDGSRCIEWRDDNRVTTIVVATCAACKAASRYVCGGRRSWQQVCMLVRDHL